ncbi:MAG: hypothetical protein ACYCZ7_02615 [Minisyncoccota bacterium]
MSIMTIIGSILYAICILFVKITIGGKEILNQYHRATMLVVVFPVVGILFTIIGLLGLVMIEPFLHFFGWKWFIITNF